MGVCIGEDIQVDFTLKILDFKKEGGRGLISREECVKVEVQSLEKYLSESKEWMLKFVGGEKRLSEVENPGTFKKHLKEEKRSQWLEKPLHGISIKDTEKVSTERMWQWLKGGHLKKRLRRWCVQHGNRHYG